MDIKFHLPPNKNILNNNLPAAFKQFNMSFLTAEWRKLIMANYEIDPAILKPHLPAFTELDFYEGRTYVSLVGFLFTDVKLLGFPIPFHRTFEEVNLRFYVRYRENGIWKRGTVFISEIVPKMAITFVANTLYKEHYSTMPMKHSWDEKNSEIDIAYDWKLKNEWQHLSVKANVTPRPIPVGHFNEFITEHYWGYNKASNKKTTEYEVRHPRWQDYKVLTYKIKADFEKLYGADFSFLSGSTPKDVLLAEGSAISIEGKKIIIN